MPLTDRAIRNLKPADKTTKYSDGGGLYLQIPKNGSKLWKMNYRFSGRQKTLSFGAYPAVTLFDARSRRDEAKAMLANGLDPSDEARKQKQVARLSHENTFNAIADESLEKARIEGRAKNTLTKKRWLLSFVRSDFGARPITEITAADILIPLRKVEARGTYETARRLRAEIGQVFRYAIATARAENDPTFGLRGALINPPVNHRAAVTDAKGFAELVRAVWTYEGSPETIAGLKLMVLLYPRPGELRKAEWNEFDLEAKTWSLPAERMKMRRDHKKPLSDLAVTILQDLHKLTGHRDLVFPSYQSPRRPMSENTLNVALRRLGYSKDEATAHGFRSSASSLLNESGKWSADAIEAELAHVGADQVRKAYHRALYWDERVAMAEWWAEEIEAMLG